ncbi:hypothetical protein VP1G_08330 [Cytospora mali]|uniref:Uncharacterized protein n=1 Tax=Cytospora mali TaxID=578113 RepID=A0A194VB96_CYTMA|nr:hypothetical protein VP1G_08330 [Valsa mali var. pyri (nom. inval.)]
MHPNSRQSILQLRDHRAWDRSGLHHVAFSRRYLTAGAGHAKDGVQVCEEAAFSAQGLLPGCTLTLEEDKGVKRLVSVAVGKVHVQLDGGADLLARVAMVVFKIGPGVGCVVANEADITAVVHVTTLMLDLF